MFEKGDLITCKRDYVEICTILNSGSQYEISFIDDDDIEISYYYNKDDYKLYRTLYFGFDKNRVNYYGNFFYTKSELRDIKLNLLL